MNLFHQLVLYLRFLSKLYTLHPTLTSSSTILARWTWTRTSSLHCWTTPKKPHCKPGHTNLWRNRENKKSELLVPSTWKDTSSWPAPWSKRDSTAASASALPTWKRQRKRGAQQRFSWSTSRSRSLHASQTTWIHIRKQPITRNHWRKRRPSFLDSVRNLNSNINVKLDRAVAKVIEKNRKFLAPIAV